MRVFLDLFIEFFQIGLFAIGGGPATIPFLMDIPSRHDWYEKGDVANMLAVSESTPGPIGVNMATYAGYNAAGVAGGIVATLSLVLPSLIVIIIVAKILESFSKYYEMITSASAEDFHIDANTNITVTEQGKQRETNTQSSGYRDLIGICLRVALVDAMYKEEAPVLIMDDPFTNLDDEKMKQAKKFLEYIAEKYQVIYFTCSESRR